MKRIPPAMEHLLKDKEVNIQGFLCPGHVSAIIGTRAYEFIVKKYRIPCCIAGFEPLDVMEGIYILLMQIINQKASVFNQYRRLVKKEGNLKARMIIKEVFRIDNAFWRGIGRIENSGFYLKKKYAEFDIEKVIPMKLENKKNKKNICVCGEVLKGKLKPSQCRLYARVCNPLNPFGPCMVSSEGACYVHYKYQKR
ncbi:MAG: hydrogenase formation protein HypD [Candidatus Omnitrophica bacterium]|nr:hydrogenase formation protein HypD [Candidatus Omnitrophota bacterium]